MKQTLIRLHSEDAQGIFDTQFKDIITISPNSSIALQSCSVNRLTTSYIVDGSNDTIIFEISPAKRNFIRLPHGTYDRTTAITDLLGAFIKEMNEALSIQDGVEFGTQINARVNLLTKLEFEVEKQMGTPITLDIVNPNAEAPKYFSLNVTATTGAGGAGIDEIKSTSGTIADNINNSYIVGLEPFTKGCGVLRTRIKHYNTGGIMIGLIDKKDVGKAKDGELAKSDIVFGIETGTNIADNYIGYLNGVATDTGVAPLKASGGTLADNDVLDIALSGGFMSCVVEQDGSTLNISSTQYRTIGQEDQVLHAFIAFKGTTQINNTECYVDVYASQSDSNNKLSIGTDIIGAPAVPENNNLVPIDGFKIIFDNLAQANFFGFDRVENTGVAGNHFVGDFGSVISSNSKLDNLIPPDRFLIELLNVPINTYDSLTGGRKNILASVPIQEHQNSHNFVIDYEPNNLIFISLNNRDPLRLRNINARVLTDEFNSLSTEGFNTISLLVKENE